jgi:hypothetical protein
MVTLGLDASTTTIGWSFFSDKLIDCGFVDIQKLNTNKEKAHSFISFIRQHDMMTKCDTIVLESALCGFISGFSSQQTILKLTRWNVIFEYILQEEFPEKNILVEGVNTIRKNVFGKCRTKGIKPKEFVKIQLEQLIDTLSEHIVYTKRGNIDKRTSDIYDAIVCSMYRNKKN